MLTLLSVRYAHLALLVHSQQTVLSEAKGGFDGRSPGHFRASFQPAEVLGSAAAGAVLVAGLAAGCSSSGGSGNTTAASGSPLTICEIAATSGPFSQLGTNDELGASAWADMVNKAGGILGHEVTLVPENDASDPATAAALVRKCVTQVHANFIFGPEQTATASAAVPIALNGPGYVPGPSGACTSGLATDSM